MQNQLHKIHNITDALIEQNVTIIGWLHNKRDHGGILFLDIRGTQSSFIQCRSEIMTDEYALINLESVIKVTGVVKHRPEGSINNNQDNGNIEINVKNIEILAPSKPLPFSINTDESVNYSLKSQYRFLDLRKDSVYQYIKLRSNFISDTRKKMESIGFTEYHTPLLNCSSPEGARDYVIPSRLHHGKFYALPQAPQIAKQLLMASGFENYFQIAPCFRDEDSRADRTPGEFYQLDIEMNIASQQDVIQTIEPIILNLFTKFANRTVHQEIIKIPYQQALNEYGTDKPDLRIPTKMIDISHINISCFKNIKHVKAIKIPSAAKQARSWFDQYTKYAMDVIGMPGLGYIKYDEQELRGPIVKFIEDTKQFIECINLQDQDVVFLLALDDINKLNSAGGQLIHHLHNMKPDIIADDIRFCWITDFPFFEQDENGKIDFGHNPFSMPQSSIEEIEASDNKLSILSYQYDMVCNGYEIASGAQRNYSLDMMKKLFNIAGYNDTEIEKNFYPLYTAMQYGLPPHAGIAFGIERMIMICANTDNIKDVLLFPMEQSGESKLMNCPSIINKHHMKELGIKHHESME